MWFGGHSDATFGVTAEQTGLWLVEATHFFAAVAVGSPESQVLLTSLSKQAVIVSSPAFVPVYENVALPPASVRPDPDAVLAPATVNRIVCPTFDPPGLSSCAVTAWLVPTGFSAVAGVSSTSAGTPVVHVFDAVSESVPTRAGDRVATCVRARVAELRDAGSVGR